MTEVDHLIDKVGIGIFSTVESYYQKYLDDSTDANAKKYLLWRLRLHRRMKGKEEDLRKINEVRKLGLMDDRPGKTCWEYQFD